MQSNASQNQDMLEKSFFEEVQPGDFVDAKNHEGEWNLVKVVDKHSKCLSLMFDGYNQLDQVNSALSTENIYLSNACAPPTHDDLRRYRASSEQLDDFTLHPLPQTAMDDKQLPSAFNINQSLRGHLYISASSLLISNIDFSETELKQISQFLLRLIQFINRVCQLAHQYSQEYLEANPTNKLIYLASPRIAIVLSLHEMLTLLLALNDPGPALPNLLKRYKIEIQTSNLSTHSKKTLNTLYQLLKVNNGRGRWLPISIRLKITKLLFRFKRLEQIQSVVYEQRDYLEFYEIWPHIMELLPEKQTEERFLDFMLTAVKEQGPFDAKLKSLQALRKVMEKQIRLRYMPIQLVSESLMQWNILGSLLTSFNPEIFKRFMPILEIACQHQKKLITHSHIDKLFDYLQNRHQSEIGTICQIIVSISSFIHTLVLDYIYASIQKNKIELLGSEQGICFIKDFTIKAIVNFNCSKNRGMFSTLIGKKKSSSKYGYYGLDLFWKQIQDGKGSDCLSLFISNMGLIFNDEGFHHLRQQYMQACLDQIQKKRCYGQCLKLLQEIVNTYPVSAYISDSQESVIYKLDEKNKILKLLIKALKDLENYKASKFTGEGKASGTVSNLTKEETTKVSFNECVKYFYELIEKFGEFFKYKLDIQNIMYMWNLPYIFDHLRKSRTLEQTEASGIPLWKKKYYKKLDKELIHQIFTHILIRNEYINLSHEAFDAIDQLFLSYNLQSKCLQITERVTVRYHKLTDMVGISYFYRLLAKLLESRQQLLASKSKENTISNNISNSSQKESIQPDPEPKLSENRELVQKVIIRIIQLYLRPYDYQQISVQVKNWMGCLLQLLNATKNDPTICALVVEKFFTLIKGRFFKDINVSGNIDIIIAYGPKTKTVTLPKNSTIFKLRESIMQAFGIKTAFMMYNTAMKRAIKHFEEQDFSVNAMGVAYKGPTISVRNVLQSLCVQHQAQQLFMNQICSRQEVYEILFKLLQEQEAGSDPLIESKLWKLLEQLPLNNSAKFMISENGKLTKKDWHQFLNPANTVQLQYRLSIVYEFMKGSNLGSDGNESKKWVLNLIKNGGFDVISQLFLSTLSSKLPLKSKLITKLSTIMLKAQQYSSSQLHHQTVSSSDSHSSNLPTICQKIMQIIDKYLASNQLLSIQLLNLLVKFLLVSSTKQQVPSQQQFLQFFITEDRLVSLAERVLFQGSEDSSFFTEEILEKIVFNYVKCHDSKICIFNRLVTDHLGTLSQLKQLKSVRYYFMFLIDFVQVVGGQQQQQELFTPPVAAVLCKFIEQAVDTRQLLNAQTDAQRFPESQERMPSQAVDKFITTDNQSTVEQKPTVTLNLRPIEQEIVNGALKLIQLSLKNPQVLKRPQRIFENLYSSFIFNGNNIKLKLSQKNKKLLFDIIKKLIYQHENLSQSFIANLAPKLQLGQWRSGAFECWNLQQQKRQKKHFCGLENQGATCYINCLFQQLFMIEKFRDRFINVDSLAYRASTDNNEIYQLQRLLVYLKYGNKRSYSTKNFCDSFITYEGLPIDPMIQNDADEFFNTLMDKIQTFLKLTQQHHILELTFQGKLSNQLNCQECPHSSEKIQPFLSIGLNIKNKRTLAEALEGYVEGETLAGDNAYYCETCQRKVRTIKRLCFKQLPNTLVIVLKRFSFNFDQMRKVKINDQCQYPQNISLKNYTSEYLLNQPTRHEQHYMYRLRGVVIHSGTSQAGHYYSFIRHQQDSKWYQFNDELIQQADYKRMEEDGFGGDEKNLEIKMEKHKNAYILLYEKEIQRTLQEEVSSQLICKEGQLMQARKQGQLMQANKQGQLMQVHKQGQSEQTCKQEQSESSSHNEIVHDFEIQLSQLVIEQNKNADLLQIMLDPLFIRLCESITMSGFSNVPEFILLYFHTILLRDKNKDEYINNIYRILAVLLTKTGDDYEKGRQQKMQGDAKIEDKEEAKIGDKEFQSEGKQLKAEDKSDHKPNIKQQQTTQQCIEQQCLNSPQKLSPDKLQSNCSLAIWFINQITPSYITQFLIQAPRVPRYLCAGLILDSLKVLVTNYIQIPEYCIQSLLFSISCKKKGLNPLGKIMSYLSSIEQYRQYLLKHNYICIVVSLLLSKQMPAIQLVERQPPSYFDNVAPVKKVHKELETLNSTLIQSLKYYAQEITVCNKEGQAYLNKQQLIILYNESSNRLYRKTMAQILAHLLINKSYKRNESPGKLDSQPQNRSQPQNQQGFPSHCYTEIQQLLERLRCELKENITRQNVQKFILMLRYLYMGAQHKLTEGNNSLEQLMKILLQMYSDLVREYRNNYLVMELFCCELNKIAARSTLFMSQWQTVVSNSSSLTTCLQYWLKQAYNPHFSLLKHDEWVSKMYGLTFPEKQLAIEKNVRVQKRRVEWMMGQGKSKSTLTNSSKQKQQNNAQISLSKLTCEQLDSEPENAVVRSRVNLGFKTYEVVEHLGLLTKLKSDDVNSESKAITHWAVLEKNDVDFLYDL